MKTQTFLYSVPRSNSRLTGPSLGFTLLELVVLLGLAALWASVLLPALARTGPSAQATRCLNNLNQLTRAWTMYATDNADAVAYNLGTPDIEAEIANKHYRNWANDIMDWTTSSLNTNSSLLSQHGLGPYLGQTALVYHCPADVYVSPTQRLLGWTGRVRSVSMNAFFGQNVIGRTSDQSYWVPGYREWLTLARVPAPAQFWVFIDEHPDSINDGLFLNSPTGSTQWGDIPASAHNGGVGLAFSDGHTEIHQWLSTSSRIPVTFTYPMRPFDAAGRTDYQWLMSRATVLY